MLKSSRHKNASVTWALLILLILLSWAVRLYRLDSKSIWSDEGLTIYRVRQDLAFNLTNQIIVQGVVTKDTQPPLYFILLHLVRAMAGEGEFALRYPSVAFAVLAIPLLYISAKRLISHVAGLAGAFLGAISAVYLWYAQEMRMYTMLVALSLLSTYALLRALGERTGWRCSKVIWLLAYLLSSGAILYTHYSGFFLLIFQGLVMAGFIIRSRRWRMAALVGVACVAALPLVPFVLRRLGSGPERDYLFVPLPIILSDLLNGFTVGISADLTSVFWLDALGLAILLVGLLTVRGDGPWGRWGKTLFLLGYLFVPVLTLYTASFVKPMYMGVRHLLIMSPAFYLTLAAGLAFLIQRRTWLLGLLAAVLLFGGNVYSTHNYFQDERYLKDDLRSMVRYIRRHFRPGDAVVLNDAVVGKVFEYYAPDMPWTALPRFGSMADEQTFAACQSLAAAHERIWYVYGPPSTYYDPQQLVRAWFEDNLFKLDFRRFTGYGVEVGTFCYATRSPVLESLPQATIQATPLSVTRVSLALLDYELALSTPSGEVLAVPLYWQAVQPLETDFKVSVRLRGQDGSYWAQSDQSPFLFFPATEWPVGRAIRHVQEIPLPPGTPPGRYQLELTAYRPDRGDVLEILWLNQEPRRAERLLLGEVDIGPALRPVRRDELPPHRKTNAVFGDTVTLLAYTWWERLYSPGDTLHVDLYWRAERPLKTDYIWQLSLLAPGGRLLQETAISPGPGTLAGIARPGDIVRAQGNLALPGDLTPGDYRLELQLQDIQIGQPLTVRAGWPPRIRNSFWLPALPIRVPPVPTPIQMAHPATKHPLAASLGDAIGFLGYNLDTDTVNAGGELELTLYWECAGPILYRYTVFTHVIDEYDVIWGQKDSIPLGGTRPTDSWKVGEILTDTYRIPIKPEAEAGQYWLTIGMYNPSTMERVPAFDAEGTRLSADQIVLQSVRVTR